GAAICYALSTIARGEDFALRLRLDYGTTGLEADFPAGTTVIEPLYRPPAPDIASVLRAALRSPIGTRPLREQAIAGKRVGISVCDITRAKPRQLMLEALFDEMPGVRMQDVTIFIATGTHRRNNPAEIEQMVGPEFARNCRIVCHDARQSDS